VINRFSRASAAVVTRNRSCNVFVCACVVKKVFQHALYLLWTRIKKLLKTIEYFYENTNERREGDIGVLYLDKSEQVYITYAKLSMKFRCRALLSLVGRSEKTLKTRNILIIKKKSSISFIFIFIVIVIYIRREEVIDTLEIYTYLPTLEVYIYLFLVCHANP